MKRSIAIHFFLLLFFICSIVIYSCSKGGGGGGGTNPNPCSGVVISISGTTVNPSTIGASNGSIAVTATGSTGFTFSINGGAFQSSGNFNNLPAGSYTVTVKDGNGCTSLTSFTLTASSVCSGVTITVSGTTGNNIPCQPSNSGSITVTASGSSGTFTYSINGGSFQVSNIFSGLNAGNYIITAKDANGCSGSAAITVNNTAAGPLFSAVKTVIQNNCAIAGCHGDVQSPVFTDQCNIVANGSLIKLRAVDGNPSPMPPTGLLPASERQKITDWVNGGGRFNN